MTESLKLTTYFGERQRVDGQFLAESLLTLYGKRQVATSVMVRGIASFGPRHTLRDDESLSLSEDPPVAVAAVDTSDKIAALADEVVAMTPRGLLTLERARFLDAALHDGDAVKLTVYVGRQERVAGMPAYRAVCELLHHEGLAGASVFLGVDGTAHGTRCRATFFSRNVDVPMMIISVGAKDDVERVLPRLTAMLTRPLVTVERVQVCKRHGQLVARPNAVPPADEQGRPLFQKLMVYTGEDTGHEGVPIHRALVRRLRASGAVSGATALRGVWGFAGDRTPHGDKLFQLVRSVPVTTIVVDTPEGIAGAFGIVDKLTGTHGLVTCEVVPAAVYLDGAARRGGTNLADYRY